MIHGNDLAAAPPLAALLGRAREADGHFSLLSRYFTPRTVFMHLGAAEGALAMRAAGYVERVYAVDPLEALAQLKDLRRGMRRLPCNLRLLFSRGGALAIEPGTVDVAFSQNLEPGRLAAVARALAKGGRYLFLPRKHDSAARLRDQLVQAGFSFVRFPPFFGVFPRRNLIVGIK
jgi:hypothetical protein